MQAKWDKWYVIFEFFASYRIKRGNGEHTQDTNLRPEMKTATQGHPMAFNERQKTTPEDRLQLAPV